MRFPRQQARWVTLSGALLLSVACGDSVPDEVDAELGERVALVESDAFLYDWLTDDDECLPLWDDGVFFAACTGEYRGVATLRETGETFEITFRVSETLSSYLRNTIEALYLGRGPARLQRSLGCQLGGYRRVRKDVEHRVILSERLSGVQKDAVAEALDVIRDVTDGELSPVLEILPEVENARRNEFTLRRTSRIVQRCLQEVLGCAALNFSDEDPAILESSDSYVVQLPLGQQESVALHEVMSFMSQRLDVMGFSALERLALQTVWQADMPPGTERRAAPWVRILGEVE
ncbi:MAG: hypothetical protein AAFY60_03360 [Myxococcota bacterium]